MSIYSDTFNQNRFNLSNVVDKSSRWYNNQARNIDAQLNVTAQQLIKSEPWRNVRGVIPGEMYLFKYDPKTKTLPQYDMFPLVLPFRRLPEGFIGLNFHYLSYGARIDLLDNLVRFRNDKTLNEHTRIRCSWATLQATSTRQYAKDAVHKYLFRQCRSSFKRIDPLDWTTAMMLPVENFVSR